MNILGRSDARNLDAPAAPPAAGQIEARAAWSDEALMAAIAGRDVLAFSALYDRYVDLVFSTALRVLASRDSAEDTVQDVFVRIWTRPEAYVPERGRFVSWLISVTRNRSVDEIRAQSRRRRREIPPAVDGEYSPEREVVDDCEPAELVQLNEERLSVRRALVDLPFEQRRALELAYFGGMTHQEIARALHEPLGTIKTRIRLGMQKLRRALEDEIR